MDKFTEFFVNKRNSNSGFKSTSNFLQQLTKKSFERRGFARSRLIINWKEIVGLELEKHSKPVRMTFPKNALGATLTIEIDGAYGPELDLQKKIIKEKVNRIYGYTAVAKINFKLSTFLGYGSLVKEEVLLGEHRINCDENNIITHSEKRGSLIPKLASVKNKRLRESLKNLSCNFIDRTNFK